VLSFVVLFVVCVCVRDLFLFDSTQYCIDDIRSTFFRVISPWIPSEGSVLWDEIGASGLKKHTMEKIHQYTYIFWGSILLSKRSGPSCVRLWCCSCRLCVCVCVCVCVCGCVCALYLLDCTQHCMYDIVDTYFLVNSRQIPSGDPSCDTRPERAAYLKEEIQSQYTYMCQVTFYEVRGVFLGAVVCGVVRVVCLCVWPASPWLYSTLYRSYSWYFLPAISSQIPSGEQSCETRSERVARQKQMHNIYQSVYIYDTDTYSLVMRVVLRVVVCDVVLIVCLYVSPVSRWLYCTL